MGRPRWVKVLGWSLAAFAVVMVVMVIVALTRPVPASTSPAPSFPASTPDTQVPAPAATLDLDAWAEGQSGEATGEGEALDAAIPDGRIITGDPLALAAAFAQIWQAPSPALYDHATYEAFLRENVAKGAAGQPNDAGWENISAQMVGPMNWDVMAEDGTVEAIELVSVKVPEWVSTTDVGRSTMANATKEGWENPTMVEVLGKVSSTSAGGGVVSWDSIELYAITCSQAECALIDVFPVELDYPDFLEQIEARG